MATLLLVVILSAAGLYYVVGGYFVDLALKRGENQTAPTVSASLVDPNLTLPPKPQAQSEPWELHSADGLLLRATHFSPAHVSHRWVILLHGYGRSQADTWDYAPSYLEHGYEVLTPDLRASGSSGGTYVTMGTLEAQDVAAWARKIVAHDPQARIVLHGISMGAATAMLAAVQPDMPANLAAVVEDSGYTSAETMFRLKMESFHLPTNLLLYLVNAMSAERTGVALSQAAPLEAVQHSETPLLLIHGQGDLLVPPAMAEELYRHSAAKQKELYEVKGAWHAAARARNPEAYDRRVFSFLDKVL